MIARTRIPKVKNLVTIQETQRGVGLIRVQRCWNVLTTSGLEFFVDVILGNQLRPRAIALGTGNSLASPAQTTLDNEQFRKVLTRRGKSGTTIARLQMFVDNDEANGNTYTECGLFDSAAPNNPTMLARLVYDSVVKDNTKQLTYTWEMELA